MLTLRKQLGRNLLLLAGFLAATCSFTLKLSAQTPAPRISAEIDNTQRAVLLGSHPPKARAEYDAGRMLAGTPLQGMSIVFSRSAAQETDLQALLAAQQDPASPLYHQWLTPEQFASRFGVADADIAKVQFWLQQQGFAIDGVSRSKNRLTFSGASDQVEAAFAVELHYYNVDGTKHFAPSTDLSIPTALAPMVQTVRNLSTFRPKPHVKIVAPQLAPQPNFTSSQSGNHYLSPGDVATIYDITPAYNAGYTGSGQSIADVGQSEIAFSDIENFESAAGLPKKDPVRVPVPNTGTPAISPGDESESDLDLEYSGAIARGATIYFVYVGNSANHNVFDALTYAIENNTAPVITISYGDCESDLGSGEYSLLNATLAQAASQGQSVISASGDNGSTDCHGNTNQSTAAQEALAVDFPASSQYVTGMGGTEFPAADVAVGNNTYWIPQGTSDAISSALSYIPEMVWNDDSAPVGSTPADLSSGGGGTSILTARPSWQTGVTGIPAGSFRLVPDISLTASPNNAGFLYCSSDTSVKVTGSCAHGFRDANNQFLTVAGGTSFDAPIFAAMVAIINQKLKSTGQGVVNPTLYKLAGDTNTYASAFHDITSGNNNCTVAGSTVCSAAGQSEFSATIGYDEASGLGSVDFNNLLTAWPGSSSSSKSFTMTATAATVTAGGSVSSTVTITPQSGYTGTIAFTVTSSPAISNACFSLPNATVSGASAVTATLTAYTSSSLCAGVAAIGATGNQHKRGATQITQSDNVPPFSFGLPIAALALRAEASLALLCLLLVTLLNICSRRLAAYGGAALLLVAMTLAMSGCSSTGSSSSTTSNSVAPKGTYTLTITGTDTSSPTISASTTATLTIN